MPKRHTHTPARARVIAKYNADFYPFFLRGVLLTVFLYVLFLMIYCENYSVDVCDYRLSSRYFLILEYYRIIIYIFLRNRKQLISARVFRKIMHRSTDLARMSRLQRISAKSETREINIPFNKCNSLIRAWNNYTNDIWIVRAVELSSRDITLERRQYS